MALHPVHFRRALQVWLICLAAVLLIHIPVSAQDGGHSATSTQLTPVEQAWLKGHPVITLAAIDQEERQTATNRWIRIEGQQLRPDKAVIAGFLSTIFGIMLLGIGYWNKTLRREVRNRTASLQQEREERQRTEQAFYALTAELEERVRERTAELEREVRERTVAEQSAKSSEQKFRALFHSIGDPIYISNMDGRLIAANNQACLTLGYSQDELLQLRVMDVDAEGQAEKVSEVFQALRDSGMASVEISHRRKDGSQFPVEVNARLIDYDGQSAVLGVARDLTERKQAEAEKETLMAHLAQAQKIESIGQLAGGVAHDFNNLLTPIIGFAELLRRDVSGESRSLEKVHRILEAADRAKILVQRLLGFGRKQLLQMQAIDLNGVVSSCYEILRRTIREDIDIRVTLTPDTYGIRADANQLEQIIMNLTINAQDAIDGKGVITIETAPAFLDGEYASQHAGVHPGHYVMLTVTDTGCGMNEETLNHLFEPFFTTKAPGKGTGLGLATVYGLVKQHKGNIWAESEPGRGSVFRIYFPVIQDNPVADVAADAEQVMLKAGNYTILLVEDNGMVRNIVRELLMSHGFTVIEAEGPLQALQMIEGRQLDLLVTDVIMPDMNGPELHHRLTSTHPDLKVLYMSGYTNNIVAPPGILEENINFIQKPFASKDLANKIATVLNS